MKKSEHYVDNQKFLEALTAYRDKCIKARARNRTVPRIPEYIGECFLKIASHLAHKHNFAGYTYREDMVSDGVENCLIYVHNFDPKKSNNPFGYFTQIIYYAFVRRIQREKKQQYIKYKMIEQSVINTGLDNLDHNSPIHADGMTNTTGKKILMFENVQDFIERFDTYTTNRRERRRRAKVAKS